jgi:hypothetical protein
MSGMPADSGRGNEEGSWARARRLSEQLLWLWVAAILYLGSSFSIHRGCVGLHVGYLRLAQPSCLAPPDMAVVGGRWGTWQKLVLSTNDCALVWRLPVELAE